MFFVVGSSVRVLKAAAFKRFSVRPCWSPILLKLQNSIAGVFQCIFNKISEHVFYRTTVNWYFGTKKGGCKYWSSIVLFESGITSEESKVQIFCSTKDHQRIHLCEKDWYLELLMLNNFQCSLLNIMKTTCFSLSCVTWISN